MLLAPTHSSTMYQPRGKPSQWCIHLSSKKSLVLPSTDCSVGTKLPYKLQDEVIFCKELHKNFDTLFFFFFSFILSREASVSYLGARNIDDISDCIIRLFQLLPPDGRAAQAVEKKKKKKVIYEWNPEIREWKFICNRCEHPIGLYGKIIPK